MAELRFEIKPLWRQSQLSLQGLGIKLRKCDYRPVGMYPAMSRHVEVQLTIPLVTSPAQSTQYGDKVTSPAQSTQYGVKGRPPVGKEWNPCSVCHVCESGFVPEMTASLKFSW